MTDYFVTGTFSEGFNSWHKKENTLGVARIVDGDTMTDATKKGRMFDVEVVKAPMYIHVGDTAILSDKTALALTNAWWNTNGIQLIDRSVSWYEPIQNAQYAEILDPLCDTYQPVGVLMCGSQAEIVVFQMAMPSFYVNDAENEKHEAFLTVSEDRKTGKKHYGVSFTRVVCMNTYFMSVNGGLKSLPNTLNAALMLQFRTQIEQAMIARREQERDALNKMFTQHIDNKVVEQVAQAILPMPQKPQVLDIFEAAQGVGYDFNADNNVAQFANKKLATTQQHYDNAMERHAARTKDFFTRVTQSNEEFGGQTAYGTFQAVTSFWNHYEGFRTAEDKLMADLFFGERQKSIGAALEILR